MLWKLVEPVGAGVVHYVTAPAHIYSYHDRRYDRHGPWALKAETWRWMVLSCQASRKVLQIPVIQPPLFRILRRQRRPPILPLLQGLETGLFTIISVDGSTNCTRAFFWIDDPLIALSSDVSLLLAVILYVHVNRPPSHSSNHGHCPVHLRQFLDVWISGQWPFRFIDRAMFGDACDTLRCVWVMAK